MAEHQFTWLAPHAVRLLLGLLFHNPILGFVCIYFAQTNPSVRESINATEFQTRFRPFLGVLVGSAGSEPFSGHRFLGVHM